MKVVILAGDIGTRISEESHLRPKPLIGLLAFLTNARREKKTVVGFNWRAEEKILSEHDHGYPDFRQ